MLVHPHPQCACTHMHSHTHIHPQNSSLRGHKSAFPIHALRRKMPSLMIHCQGKRDYSEAIRTEWTTTINRVRQNVEDVLQNGNGIYLRVTKLGVIFIFSVLLLYICQSFRQYTPIFVSIRKIKLNHGEGRLNLLSWFLQTQWRQAGISV